MHDVAANGSTPIIVAVVLAAGSSTRSGNAHKLLAKFDGVSMVRWSTVAAVGSGCNPVFVVIGHRAEQVHEEVADLPVRVVRNPFYASGMSTSIVAGVREAIGVKASGLMICLADMPRLTRDHLTGLAKAFVGAGGEMLIRAADNGVPGHPIIFPPHVFHDLLALTGDVGGREIVERYRSIVRHVEIGNASRSDFDTLENLRAAGWCVSTCSER